MLRTSLVVLGAGIVIVGGLTLFKQPEIVYERLEPEKEVVVETVVEKELDSRIKTAQDAKLAEVEAKAKAAYDAAYTQAMDEIKLEVITEYRKEVQQMETELSKSVGAY